MVYCATGKDVDVVVVDGKCVVERGKLLLWMRRCEGRERRRGMRLRRGQVLRRKFKGWWPIR